MDGSLGRRVASTVDVTVVSSTSPTAADQHDQHAEKARTATSRARVRAKVIDQPPSVPLPTDGTEELCSRHADPHPASSRVAREIVRSDRREGSTAGCAATFASPRRTQSAEQPPDDQEREQAAHGDERVLDLRVVQGGGEGPLALVDEPLVGLARVVSSSTATASASRARSISAWIVSASRATAPPVLDGRSERRPAVHYPSGMNSPGPMRGDVGTEVGRSGAAPPFTLQDADGQRRRYPTSPGAASSSTSIRPR